MKENAEMIDEYLNELVGDDLASRHRDEFSMCFAGKSFFQINKADKPIGFGVYTTEDIGTIPSFFLHEFFVRKPFRSLSGLYEIRRQIALAIKILGLDIWACLVDKDEDKNIRAYEGLGFEQLAMNEDGLVIMGQSLENL